MILKFFDVFVRLFIYFIFMLNLLITLVDDDAELIYC